ncbi:hypothetical protein JG687_00011261 [Phytophthora cactorum]|uniref:EF-hand domain-containing protein n=1 Tax=Phytophthora cactorum TaxID=29920 RepID=A0A8T1U6Z3_9STRA|nr:hypothetical protein JG687_00011261 [Phytophthora cactorum]
MDAREPLLDGDEHCRELFKKFDKDKQGVLSREGVRSFIHEKFVAKGIECMGELDYDIVVDKVFHRRRQEDRMTYSEFETDFAPIESDDKSKEEHGKVRIESKATVQHLKRGHPKTGHLWHRVKKWCRKYTAEIFWLALYFQLMVAVFVSKAAQFGEDPAVGHCIRVAKGFAHICLVNTVLVLLPMCRNLVTGLRALPVVTSYLPIDQHIEFHKICGVVLLLAALGHTAAWIAIIIYAREAPKPLSEMDTDNRLEIHTFYTAKSLDDVIGPLEALQTFIHATEGQDIVSGLQTKQKTHFGRPDWNAELSRIARNHIQLEPLDEISEEIGVFFCGPKKMGRDIHDHCALLNQAKERQMSDAHFDFHSEKF